MASPSNPALSSLPEGWPEELANLGFGAEAAKRAPQNVPDAGSANAARYRNMVGHFLGFLAVTVLPSALSISA